MAKVTVLGMGAMGSRMAIALLKAGHEVTVWNRSHRLLRRKSGETPRRRKTQGNARQDTTDTWVEQNRLCPKGYRYAYAVTVGQDQTEVVRQAGAEVATTPCSAAQNAEFVISMVRDDQASQQVWLSDEGAMAGMDKTAIAIVSSTLSVAWVKELGNRFQQQEIAFLDAPVAGTLPQAEAAELIYFVGGDAATLQQATPVLQAMGSKIYHTGSVGSGMVIKLAVNSLFAIQVAAWGEIVKLIEQSGLELSSATNILTATPVCSPVAKLAAKSMVAGNFTPLFPIELVQKDLNYAFEIAGAKSPDSSLIATAQAIYNSGINQGYGADNITGIAQIYQ